MIDSVLVANRGEIALRIMRTCARLGIRSVAIHTDLDAAAPHVRAADAAVHVDSYLDVDQVVAAAVSAGAAAVHPGYGFLSERAAFAQAVTDAGLVFVGPTASVIERMGRKDVARDIAEGAGVPVTPRGEAAGYPVLVKAAAGGGGKGMRIVRDPADLDDAVAAARREAASAFGDDTILIEKLVEHGRHLEVQVIGDAQGTVLHLHERDCSVQRRHQKVIEEAPAPTIDAALRDRLTTAAVALAAEVGYTNAGTVEFLLDVDSGEFYFLEMNTRLQVEHPVTEAICGDLDLVELQLIVADGRPLPLAQSDVPLVGHAMEARIYAEDPYSGFLPQAGTARSVHWPRGVRVDQALESGQVVSTAYDPMLGKVVVHGPDRETARRALVAALDDTAITGLTTNTGFLRDLAASELFADAAIETALLDRVEWTPGTETLARAIAAVHEAHHALGDADDPWRGDGWRAGGPPATVTIDLDRPVEVDPALRVLDFSDDRIVVAVEGSRVSASVRSDAREVEVVVHGERWVFARATSAAGQSVAATGSVTSPMPGSVVAVRVAVGDAVVADDVLGTVEAMKMEHALRAPFDGRVTEVVVDAGDQVALGDLLFVVEADA